MLKDTWPLQTPVEIDLSDSIPGFSLGLLGMHEGETREIYIHPKVGYGLYTTSEKGIYISAKVHLISILPSAENDVENNQLESFDFSSIFNRAAHDFDTLLSQEGYVDGHRIWSHYKVDDTLSLQKVISSLKKFEDLFNRQNNLTKDTYELSEGEVTILNRLHWNIYQQSLMNKR